MDKGLKIIGVGLFTVFTGIAVGVAVKTLKAANTSDKLRVDFGQVKFSSVKYVKVLGISVPKSAILSVQLNLKNPTSNDLSVSKTDLTLSIVGAAGTKTLIANTANPNVESTTIKANGITAFIHDVEIPFGGVLGVLPNFVDYAINRFRGAVASQKVLADVSLDAMGITLSQSKTILI